MNNVDNTICSHGVSFDDDCDKCEIKGLEESLSWMRVKVESDEKRLSKLTGGSINQQRAHRAVHKVLHAKNSSKSAKTARGSALTQ